MKYSKVLQFIVIGIIAAIVTFLFYRQKVDFFESVDLKLKDARFKIRKTVQPDNRVVIVAIDSKSVNELGRWPWKRSIMADLLDSLKDYGVKVSALDIVFSETSDKKDDEILSRSIKKNGNVILGYFFRDEEEKPDSVQISQIQSSKIKLIRIQEGVTSVPIPERPYVEANISIVGQGALDYGFFNADPDADGPVRKAVLLMLYQGEIYPSLALKALRHYTEKEIMLDIASFGVSSLRLGQMSIPSNEGGKLVVNYYGKSGTFATFSAVDIIKKRIAKKDLEDKIVFIGATEVGIYDMRATPVQAAFPGVEIHATVASSVLQGRYILRDTRVIGIEILCLLFLPLILVLILSFLKKSFLGLITFILTICAYMFLNYTLFKNYSIDMSVLYPLSSTAIAFVSAEAYRNLVFEKRNRYLKKAFSSYVSPELVSEIIKNPDRLALGGEKKEVTILFSDIRGFTGISEKLQPDVLVSLLNEYLGPMTKVVLKNNGTLDKYIGDAIMSIYNAPLDVPDHPLKACQTAIEMINELKIINESFKEKGLPSIDIGIGINTGYAVVGNMGADMRFDYTAIGDTVNLASRLEGQNKYYGTHIILSEYTAHRVKYKSILREVDLLKVVGKERPVAIFELMAEQNEKLAEEFSMSLKLYRGAEFKKALAAFKKLSAEYNDSVSRVYAERCNEYIKTPPSDSWDGIFVSMKK